MTTPLSLTRTAARLRTADCDIADFVRIVSHRTDIAEFPLATEVVDNVVVYEASRLRDKIVRNDDEEEVAGELVRVLTDGPGVLAIRGAFPDLTVVDRVTSAFDAIIAEE